MYTASRHKRLKIKEIGMRLLQQTKLDPEDLLHSLFQCLKDYLGGEREKSSC